MLTAEYTSLDKEGKEDRYYRTYLVVKHNNKELYRHVDKGEPEDNSFYRDWNWVAFAIEDAYKLGLKDANEI